MPILRRIRSLIYLALFQAMFFCSEQICKIFGHKCEAWLPASDYPKQWSFCERCCMKFERITPERNEAHEDVHD